MKLILSVIRCEACYKRNNWRQNVDVPLSKEAIDHLREQSRSNLKAAKKEGKIPFLYDVHINRLIAALDAKAKER
jgi:hypothetical protein